MNVVIINGQTHKGSTYHVGKMLADKLAQENEITEFFLPKDLNHFCVGCYQCIEHEEKCPFFEEKKVIIDEMKKADLLIFTTPNYCMAPSAPMKSFIDLMFDYWMSHRPREWMFHKKAVVISTTAGAGASQAIKIVKKSLQNWGIPYVKSYGISVQAMNWAGVKEERKAKIDKAMDSLALKISRCEKPKAGIKTKFLFKFYGGMHKSGFDSSPLEQQYWKDNGWFDKSRPWKD